MKKCGQRQLVVEKACVDFPRRRQHDEDGGLAEQWREPLSAVRVGGGDHSSISLPPAMPNNWRSISLRTASVSPSCGTSHVPAMRPGWGERRITREPTSIASMI